MRGERLSILGLYNYDHSIFDNLVLPTYTVEHEEDDGNGNMIIVTDTYDYLDRDTFIDNLLLDLAEMELLYTDGDFMKLSIGIWSKRRLHSWEKIARVLYADYDPFINIRRHEDRTITETRDLANGATTTTDVSAWDSANTYEPRTQETLSGTDTGDITTHEEFDLEGDSAITDAQDVARKEIELRDHYDLYNYIIEDFKKRFCLLLY